ncbi:sulfurtransferase complex subunit TusB [bacterium]|nr:sulfurtransferase complex subunit TusB [bacterium]MBU1615634.1 sulfurtransferase complex subunit TusB [bacterium]
MLHTVNKSPFLSGALESCLRFAQKDDPILFYEDGVYAAMSGTKVESLITDVIKEHPVYALRADLSARGIDSVIDGVNIVDYAGFVELVEQHKTNAWL